MSRHPGIRIGLDLVAVQEVQEALTAHGDRYAERVYTAGERADATVAGRLSARRLAARFAAKEATIKVLGPGDDPVAWTAIEVVTTAAGGPELRLTGTAHALALRAGLPELSLSLTEGATQAAAVVVATPRTPAG